MTWRDNYDGYDLLQLYTLHNATTIKQLSLAVLALYIEADLMLDIQEFIHLTKNLNQSNLFHKI